MKCSSSFQTISRGDSRYPARLCQRLGTDAPPELTALGNLYLLSRPMTALFCSGRCPGNMILRAYDQAAQWRDTGHCVISGFHSPVEKECLRILLRGEPPIIICPARAMPQRIARELKAPLAAGRLLILSAFPTTQTRVTAELAARRNAVVSALATETLILHVTPGGRLERSLHRLENEDTRARPPVKSTSFP
jgi:predicted Rossmann fold nucleotide-binding protein DprA/Smf involved in DNA uptake